MRMPALGFLPCALWVFTAAAAQGADPSRVAALIVDETNDFRRGEGLQPLGRDHRLGEAARAFAAFMATTGKYGHEADGNTPAVRARREGYDYCLVAENIAYQYNSAGFATAELAQRFVQGWVNSPDHRKNMLERGSLQTAVAVAQGARNAYYAVQMFGRPKSASTVFRVRNASSVTVRYRVASRAFTLQPLATITHTECTPETLHFELPAGATGTVADFTARNGDTYSLALQGGQLSVKRQ